VVVLNLVLNFVDLASITYVLFIYLLFPFLYNPSSLVTYNNTKLSNLSDYTPSSTETLSMSDYDLTKNLYKTTQLVGGFSNISLQNHEQDFKTPTSNNRSLNYQPTLHGIDSLESNKQLNMPLRHLNQLLNNKYFLVVSSNFSKDLDLMKTDR